MAASANIIVLLTARSIALAQWQNGRVSGLREVSRGTGDLIQAVETALDALTERPAKVWLFAEELWSQPVTISADIARRVPPAQLAQYVCFEIEPLSGISPRQGMAGVAPLAVPAGSDPVYWVTETDRTLFEQIEGMIVSRGGRLAGLLHPAGAPGSLLEPTSTSWRRLEVWSDMVVCLAGQGRSVERQLIPRSLAPEEWFAEASRWLGERPRGQTDEVLLVADDVATRRVVAGMQCPVITASEASAQWLAAWATGVPKLTGLPQLLPSRKGLPQSTKRLLAVAATVLVAVGCIAGYQVLGGINQAAINTMRQETEALQGPTAMAQQTRTTIAKLGTELTTVINNEKELGNSLAKFKTSTQLQRQRIPTLLTALSKACGDDVLLKSIESDGREMKIVGRCLDARRANDVARVLAVELGPLGLDISLPDKNATLRLNDGAPHDFEFIIAETNQNSN